MRMDFGEFHRAARLLAARPGGVQPWLGGRGKPGDRPALADRCPAMQTPSAEAEPARPQGPLPPALQTPAHPYWRMQEPWASKVDFRLERAAAAQVFADPLPAGITLGPGNSQSYAKWLTRLARAAAVAPEYSQSACPLPRSRVQMPACACTRPEAAAPASAA